MDLAAITSFTLILAWTALKYGGVLASDWSMSALAIGVLASVYFLLPRPKDRVPRISYALGIPACLLAMAVVVQLLPLPMPVLRMLSPVRAQLSDAMGGVLGPMQSGMLSMAPARTLIYLSRLLACLAILFLARSLCWRCRDRLWLVSLPLIAVGVLEALLGLVQFSMDRDAGAHGTYVNRNHFAGLLEMVLPFAVMFGVKKLRDGQAKFETKAGPVIAACALFGFAAAIFLAAIFSVSRMGFIACLFGLFLCGALSLVRGRSYRGWISAAALGLLIVAGAFAVSTRQLVARFADISADGNMTPDGRLGIWRDSTHMIRPFLMAGSGLGTFESAFHPYQDIVPLQTVNFAHNDYVQTLIELGAGGFAAGLFLVFRAVRNGMRACTLGPAKTERYLGVACVASLGALLLHSFADFNLYIPANALVAAWVIGTTEGLYLLSRGDATRRKHRESA